jgi:nuclear pore complex protein Nup205
MLYYDGRKAICDSLCLLAQARRGVSWEFSSPCISRLIAAYMDQLVANNLISNVLGTYYFSKWRQETIVKIISELLGQLSVSKEMEKLQKNRGLGGPKHQRLIYDIITGTRQTLADTVFCLSAQAGLPQSAIVPLVKHISDIKSEKT